MTQRWYRSPHALKTHTIQLYKDIEILSQDTVDSPKHGGGAASGTHITHIIISSVYKRQGGRRLCTLGAVCASLRGGGRCTAGIPEYVRTVSLRLRRRRMALLHAAEARLFTALGLVVPLSRSKARGGRQSPGGHSSRRLRRRRPGEKGGLIHWLPRIAGWPMWMRPLRPISRAGCRRSPRSASCTGRGNRGGGEPGRSLQRRAPR